ASPLSHGGGRLLCSIIEASGGWQNTPTAQADADIPRRKYGPGTYQKLRNEFHRNTRDNFLVELGKRGLGKRDLTPNVNFFVKVVVEDDGALAWVPGNSQAGSTVALRAELPTLVILSNTP